MIVRYGLLLAGGLLLGVAWSLWLLYRPVMLLSQLSKRGADALTEIARRF